MIINKKLTSLINKYPEVSIREVFSLFLAKNLPLKIKNISINQKGFQAKDCLIYQELQTLDQFFNVSIFRIKGTLQASEIFGDIPLCKRTEYPEIIEQIFDNLICAPNKNITGTFYTPKLVADLLVKETCPVPLSTTDKILDPACGAGVFLRSCLRSYLGNIQDKLNFIQTSLFGFDLNPEALEICKLLLLIEALNESEEINNNLKLPNLSDNFCCLNSLTSEASSRYNYIFCNPPFGLSRNQQIDSTELSSLTLLYRWFFTGKLNKYLIFILKCYQLLEANGRAGILTPNSWLGIKDGESLRKYLTQQGAFQKILTFDNKIFPKLGVETVISILSKVPSSYISLERFNSKLQVSKTTKLSTAIIEQSPNYTISTNWNNSFAPIFLHLEEVSTALRNVKSLTPAIALQVYSRNKGIPPQSAEIVQANSFHYDHQKTATCIPYLQGKDVNSYQIKWSGQYLDYGPWIAEFQDLKVYSTPRLVLREVLGKPPYILKACIISEKYLYNRSILHILSKNIELLKLLEIILNSKFASFYLLIKGRKANRKIFPKIVLDDLKDFPLPTNLSSNQSELSSLSQKPYSDKNRDLLDKLVYKQYSLTPEYINIIEQTLDEWKATS